MRAGILSPALAGMLMLGCSAMAEIAISANDNKMVLVNGVATVVKNPAPDTVTVIELGPKAPKAIAEIAVPTSVVGPPLSAAIAPDEKLALVTAATKIDPSDPTKTVPDNKLSVIDLEAKPPKVVATLEAGAGAAGVSINRAGTLAIVANRSEGTISVFKIAGKQVTSAGKLEIAAKDSGISHVAFTPDGKAALLTRDNDHFLTLLKIDGDQVSLAKRNISAGLRPYGLDISAKGDIAVVANIGRGGGDNDTVSVIDLKADPPRTVSTITVGQTPEGIKMSQDGNWVAVMTMNGSNKPKESPFYADYGRVLLFKVEGKTLRQTGEVKIGHWSQGLAFSRDGKTVLVGNMVEKDVQVLRNANGKLTDTGQRIKVGGGSAALRTADKPVKTKE